MKIIGKVVNDFTRKYMTGVAVTDGVSLKMMPLLEADLYLHNGSIDNFLECVNNDIKLKDFDNSNIPMYLQDGTAYQGNPVVVLYRRENGDYTVVLSNGEFAFVDESDIIKATKLGVKLANARIVNNKLVMGMGKQKIKFEVYQNLKDCKDSMLFNAGERIAKYGTDDNYVLLTVYGEVRVEYKGKYYYRATDMPQALVDMFENGRAYDSDYVYIGESNWFDYVHVLNGQIMAEDIACESDIAEMTKEELKAEMSEMYKYFNKFNCG